MSLATADGRSVVALRRGLAILDAFSGGRRELGVNELARMLDMHKSTVSRLCSTLEVSGYLTRDAASEKYRLGARIQQFSGSGAVELRTAARDVLHHLVETTGETVTLVVREGLDVVTIDVIDGPKLVRMQARIGARTQVHASAGAKAILAWLPEHELNRVIDAWPLARLTPNTLVTKSDLLRNLDDVREHGFSLDAEEMEIGLRCIGAPVRDQTGEVVAAIAVSGPRHRMDEAEIDGLANVVRNAADAISARLGAPVTRSVASARADGSADAPRAKR